MELPSIYSQEHYDTKARRYGQTLRYLFGVRVDQTTLDRWSSLISFARGIDTYLDGGDRLELPGRTQNIAKLLQEPDRVARQFPPLAVEQLGCDTYCTVQQLGMAIVHTNVEIKSTPNISEYAHLRRFEGNLYAQLICSVPTPQTAGQPGFTRFARWLQPVGEVTNLVNSINGIHQDYAQGELALEPDRLTRLRLLGHTAIAIRDAFYDTDPRG